MKILHIDSSILGNSSVTRDLSAATVAHIKARHPDAQVEYRDLALNEIRHLNGAIAAGFRPGASIAIDDSARQEHLVSEALVSEFLASDVLVIGAPMYNFSVSSHLKAWLDRIAQMGRTFKYTDKGPVGLTVGKRVIIVSARGGFYAQGPAGHMDFQENYLKAFFGFLGVTDVQVVRAEGASKTEEVRNKGIEQARAAIAEISL